MPRQPTAQSDEKQVAIKTGIVKRLVKEVAHYKVETQQHESRVEQMKSDGKDVYDIKKAQEILDETRMMITDASRRLDDALDELENLMDAVGDNPAVQAADCYPTAKELLASRGN
ncbi:hypothetical protein CTAYLR_004401 [Chrysophaeum taylorii]|uniref:Tubulin-specific chaperone A n=1 Tax=Chrysophaeum taylorii TaxID=2483200 RepID=A0AAD7XQW7_9STRA|nr:hypothetical protein CTAYLR_004401 [Chrysophaeum taylorii]